MTSSDPRYPPLKRKAVALEAELAHEKAERAADHESMRIGAEKRVQLLADLTKMRVARDEAITESRRLCERLDAAEEALERAKEAVESCEEMKLPGEFIPRFWMATSVHDFILSKLEAALVDQQEGRDERSVRLREGATDERIEARPPQGRGRGGRGR